MIIPILQMDTLRYREVKLLTQVSQLVSGEARIAAWALTHCIILALVGWMSQFLPLNFSHIHCLFLGWFAWD